MENYIKITDDKILIGLCLIADDMDCDDLEEIFEMLIDIYNRYKKKIKEEIKLKKRRGGF